MPGGTVPWGRNRRVDKPFRSIRCCGNCDGQEQKCGEWSGSFTHEDPLSFYGARHAPVRAIRPCPRRRPFTVRPDGRSRTSDHQEYITPRNPMQENRGCGAVIELRSPTDSPALLSGDRIICSVHSAAIPAAMVRYVTRTSYASGIRHPPTPRTLCRVFSPQPPFAVAFALSSGDISASRLTSLTSSPTPSATRVPYSASAL